ncbi:MAG: hydrogen peroxide-dependent heme synthase [Actinomycetota bacterium]
MAEQTYTYFPVFQAYPRFDAPDPQWAAQEADGLFKAWEARVQLRGIYSTVGFRADADLMMWWVSTSAEEIQNMLVSFRRTTLGRSLEQTWGFMGVHRPPEVSKDHVPAFMRGESPRKYLNVYPFVRSHDWYLMPAEERAALLKEHGEMGREFPGVLANTTSGFGLGDWEWILAFEADELTDIVDCIRRLRDAEARRFTKEETPFVTGIRKELSEAIADVF